MYCIKCGAKNDKANAFCTACGAQIKTVEKCIQSDCSSKSISSINKTSSSPATGSLVKNKVVQTLSQIHNKAIRYCKSNEIDANRPTELIGFYLLCIMFCIGTIANLIGFIKFIICGGYAQQVNLIGKGGWMQAFTTGSAGTIYGWPLLLVLLTLALSVLILCFIEFFLTSSKKRRNVMVSLLVALAGVAVAFFLLTLFMLYPSPTVVEYLAQRPERTILLFIHTALLISLIGLPVSILVCLCCKQTRGLYKKMLLSNFMIFAGMPLIILLAENILPLGFIVLIILVILVVVLALCGGSPPVKVTGGGLSDDQRAMWEHIIERSNK